MYGFLTVNLGLSLFSLDNDFSGLIGILSSIANEWVLSGEIPLLFLLGMLTLRMWELLFPWRCGSFSSEKTSNIQVRVNSSTSKCEKINLTKRAFWVDTFSLMFKGNGYTCKEVTPEEQILSFYAISLFWRGLTDTRPTGNQKRCQPL